jgi:hypothetical protein
MIAQRASGAASHLADVLLGAAAGGPQQRCLSGAMSPTRLGRGALHLTIGAVFRHLLCFLRIPAGRMNVNMGQFDGPAWASFGGENT